MGLLKIKNNGSWLNVITDYAARALVTAHNAAVDAHQNLFNAKADATTLNNHTSNTSNPHAVTAAQVGLGNCDNTSDANKPVSTATQTALDAKADVTDVDAIEAKIPSQASSSNQLADKSFVNSSIATETANYISNAGEPFTSVAQLEAYSGTVTNNDYAFVTGTDSEGNAYYDRYKATVSGSTVTWAKEFRLNNSSFTAAQWSAISSGITANLVASYDAHLANTSNPHGVTAAQVGLGNVDNTSDANKPISTATQTALDGKENKGKITINDTEYTVITSTTDAGTAGYITFVVSA